MRGVSANRPRQQTPATPLPALPACAACLQRLPAILLEVMEEEQLQGLPLYALGGSSGGSIVLRLAQIMPEVQVRHRAAGWRPGLMARMLGKGRYPGGWQKQSWAGFSCRPHLSATACASAGLPARLPARLQGVISQITPVNPSIFKLDKGAARSSFPPVLFVHMAQRDPEKAETVAEALRICK